MTDVIEFRIGDPWFNFIIAGRKTIEGKLAKGKALQMKPGSVLHISGSGARIIECQVTAVRSYKSFIEYFGGEGLRKALPEVDSIENGLAVYAQYYPAGLDEQLGVLAVELRFIRLLSD
jgi:ASC-1-like (ASCH) protein